MRQDQGFGLVLYPVGELAPGSYPAFDPGIDTVQRPGVSAAARWFTDQDMAGFQSDSGSLELQRSGDRLRRQLRVPAAFAQHRGHAAGERAGFAAWCPGPVRPTRCRNGRADAVASLP